MARCRVGLPLSHFEHLEEDFASYSRIEGEPLSRETLLQIGEPLKKRIVEQLGTFLQRLHGVPKDALDEAEVSHSGAIRTREDWLSFYEQLEGVLFPHLWRHQHLDPARPPRIYRDHVVHEESNLWVALHLLILLVPGEVVPADLDPCATARCSGTRDGNHRRLAVRTEGRQPPEELALLRYSISSSWNTLMPYHPPRRRRPGPQEERLSRRKPPAVKTQAKNQLRTVSAPERVSPESRSLYHARKSLHRGREEPPIWLLRFLS